MKKRKPKLHIPCKSALLILRIELPIIMIGLVAFLISYLQACQIDPLAATSRWSDAMEYIFASILSAVGVAFFADVLHHDLHSDKDP